MMPTESGVSREMPRYQSHKMVHALKIKDITTVNEDGSSSLSWEDQNYGPQRVDGDWMKKHNPQPGGYYVVYADGYQSYSPAQAFEEGYLPVAFAGAGGMSFGEALEAARLGSKIARSGWNGAGQYVELQVPDEHSKMSLPYLFIRTVQGDLVPWMASQTDILAHDWRIRLS